MTTTQQKLRERLRQLYAKSPYYVQRDGDRWLVISRAVKDDCPIMADFATAAEAYDYIAQIYREVRENHGIDWGVPDVPLDQRGFGV